MDGSVVFGCLQDVPWPPCSTGNSCSHTDNSGHTGNSSHPVDGIVQVTRVVVHELAASSRFRDDCSDCNSIYTNVYSYYKCTSSQLLLISNFLYDL